MAVSPAVAETTDALLAALDRVEWAQRHLFPPRALELADRLAPHAELLAGPLGALEAAPWPEDLRLLRERLAQVTRQAIELIGAFASAAQSGEPIGLYRALRRLAPLQEALYPLAPVLDPVSRWFLEPGRRGDDVLVRRLRDAALRDDGARVGVLHARNDYVSHGGGSRGGFSLYVPETWEAAGRRRRWWWRCTGAAATAATSCGPGCGRRARAACWCCRRPRSTARGPSWAERTWTRPGCGRRSRTSSRATRWTARASCSPACRTARTYALLCGLAEGMPFTHLAPACGVLHPFLLARGDIQNARGRPIYLVHGALDWMFPVQTARMSRDALQMAGAEVVYREIEDLSHTYPRDENPRILDWLARG